MRPGPKPRDLFRRVQDKTLIGVDTGCFVYSGGRNKDGYCQLDNGALVHRYMYGRIVGQIADGLELDHLCRVRSCWRIDHLEPVTHAENVRRANRLRATVGLVAQPDNFRLVAGYCRQGHPFDGKNVYVNSMGSRVCRECRRERESKGRVFKRSWRFEVI